MDDKERGELQRMLGDIHESVSTLLRESFPAADIRLSILVWSDTHKSDTGILTGDGKTPEEARASLHEAIAVLNAMGAGNRKH